jgi:hypothetical protein
MINLRDVAWVEGSNLALRLIESDDADYVFGFRTAPAYNLHLSKVSGTVEDQWRWIKGCKAREAQLSELYYAPNGGMARTAGWCGGDQGPWPRAEPLFRS